MFTETCNFSENQDDRASRHPSLDIDFDRPDVELIGELSESSAAEFIHQLKNVNESSDPVLVSMTTPGGDAEMARRIIWELSRFRQRSQRRLIFAGKTQVYSAGISVMASFPIADRFLTEDCWILIHCRQLHTQAELSGPIRHSLPLIESLAAQIRMGMQLEDEGFRRLIADSNISFEEIQRKACSNWYLTAEDALERRLIADVI